MFYVFVTSKPIELKLDSALEDISRSHNKKKKKKKMKKKKKTQIFRRVPMRLLSLPRSQAPRSPIQLLTAISVA